jgi:hypothetical protein
MRLDAQQAFFFGRLPHATTTLDNMAAMVHFTIDPIIDDRRA